MAEYIDIDAQVVVTDTRGTEHETTLRHIFEMNKWICSECGYKLFDRETNYCPNCGTRMEG